MPTTYMFDLSRTLSEAWGVPSRAHEVRPFHLRPLARCKDGGLEELRVDREGFLTFIAGESYEFRICSLEYILSELLMSYAFGEDMLILGAPFCIDAVERELLDPVAWYTEAISTKERPQSSVYLRFLTPTSFQVHGSYLPLPVPNLLFRSWIQRWDPFKPIVFGEGSAESVNRGIVMRPHTLHGVTWRAGGARIPAFVGSMELRLLPGADEIARVLFSVLTRYAPYCGTGVKTALGMGATEVIA